MRLDDIRFSIHDYDQDGWPMDRGIFLHFGETRVKVADNLYEFKEVVKRINGMETEIRDNYQSLS